jgi:hypothetical protein
VVLIASFEDRLTQHSAEAVDLAVNRFLDGMVPNQSKKFFPPVPEFMDEVRLQEEYISLRARPRIEAPKYQPGPLAPFQVAQQKKFAENSHLPVLFENINFDEWRKMSSHNQIPPGSKWVAALGIVYGPENRQSAAA